MPIQFLRPTHEVHRGDELTLSNTVEIPPSLFHPFTLTPSTIVFVENARRHVYTITDDIFRNIAIRSTSGRDSIPDPVPFA